MKKRALLLGLCLILLIPVSLFALLGSASGSRWLLTQVLSALPAETSVAQIEGNFLQQIKLSQLHYESANERIDIAHFNLSWQPGQLLSGRLKLVDLSLDGVDIIIKQTPPAEPNTFDFNAEVFLPLQLILENFSITNLHYEDGSAHYNLQQLKLSALTEQNQLKITTLTIESDGINANLQAQVTLGKQFPFSLKSQLQMAAGDYGHWQAETLINGDINQVAFDIQQSSPFKLKLKGGLDKLQTALEIKARGDWEQLSWPLATTQPQIMSEKGYFEINGPLDAYQLTLVGPLTQDYLPGAQLNFQGKGSPNGINIENLQIASDAGSLLIAGMVDWQTNTVFDLNTQGKNFNPAIFLPDLPGKLTFDSHIQGNLSDKSNQIQLAINTLNGQLRGNPIDASGKLAMADDIYTINQLTINSGRNRISADGSLSSEQSNLLFNIDTPALATLWPGLAGSLKGAGKIQGNLKQPVILFQAKGQQLKYQDQQIQKLSLAIDYQPDNQRISTLQFTANAIKTADQDIASVILNGSGSLKQHQFTLDIQSSLVSLSTILSGSMHDQDWQGNLSKLNLDSADLGKWQLKAPSKIQASKQDAGIELSLPDTCLIQNSAALCVSSHYQANSDFDLQLKATELPTALLQAYLPAQWQLKGLVNADTELQQRKGVLAGNFRLEMPANSKVILQEPQNRQEMTLGRLSIDGTLKNNLLSSHADLALTGKDNLTAQLQLNTHASQILSGQIKASIADWSLFRAFMPGVSELSGQLTTDLKLQGNLSSPLIAGDIDLLSAKLEMAEAGVALDQINLHVQASGGQNNSISLKGSATPKFLPKSDSKEAMEFTGIIDVSAEIQQRKNQFNGHYQLAIPANSSLGFKNAQTQITVPFAASTLSGDINGDQLSANLELLMSNQDFLRVKLQADTGPSKSLKGQVNASMQDLALFNALAPELSNIKGQIKADLSVNGSMEQPISQGYIQLTQGATDVASLGISLRDINLKILTADEQGQRMQVTGSVNSAKGQLNLNGLVGLDGKADISIQGSDFEVAKLPVAEVTLSPDLKLTLAETESKLSGYLLVPKAIITLKEIPKNAVTVSEDEVIKGQTISEKKPGTTLGLNTNIDVELGPLVRFSGQGLTTELHGKLKINQSGDKTAMHGTIDMKNGRYQSYGQDLTVRKGRFMFDGPVDSPWLDVEAIRVSKDQNVTAILSLTGPLKAPKTRIYSEPSLPESEALAYLLTGSSLNQVGKSDGSMVAGAALSYGAGQLSWLTEKLGVDEFEVKQGKALQDTMLAVGQYLTPDFYVGTKVGIFNQQAVLVLKHKLSQSFNVETQAGTSQRIKLNYEIDTN